MSTIEETLKERGSRYGDFIDNAEIAQDMKEVMQQSPRWDEMPADMREGLEVIVQKISRILTGDPFYQDNWHDIIGYARLVEKRLEGRAKLVDEALNPHHDE